MNSVNNLIFNALVRHQSINLPGIGSLNVVSTPAEMKKKGLLIPPSTRIELSASENSDFENILTLLATQNGLDYDSAMGIYTSWLEGSKSEIGINIESVGQIKQNFFTPTEDLNSILNPAGSQSVSLSKKMEGGQITLWVIGAILMGAMISAGAIYLLERGSESVIERSFKTVNAGTDAGVATAAASNPSDTTMASGISTDASSPFATTAPPSASTTTSATSNSTSAAITPGTISYYVVVGCYSNETNANKFITAAKKVDASIGYNLLPLRNGKFMIYTSVSTTEAEADIKKAAYAKIFKEAWVYKHTAR